MVTAATRVAAVMGDPIAHSLSPTLHNAGYEALGLDCVYLGFRVDRSTARAALRGISALGLVGVNLTMPLKAIGASVADRRGVDVEAVGAANTLVDEGGSLVAHNTDVEGFIRACRDGLGIQLSGRSAVVIGAGGAARAVIAALRREGAERVTVLARRRRPGEAAAALGGAGTRAVPLRSKAAGVAVARGDLVVNATPVGMDADDLPDIVTGAIGANHSVMDLVYSPPETPLLAAARAAGARALGGLGMLVHQAGLAFTLFTGQPAPLEAMSAAAIAVVSREHAGRYTDLG